MLQGILHFSSQIKIFSNKYFFFLLQKLHESFGLTNEKNYKIPPNILKFICIQIITNRIPN